MCAIMVNDWLKGLQPARSLSLVEKRSRCGDEVIACQSAIVRLASNVHAGEELDRFGFRCEVTSRQPDHRVVRGDRLLGGDVIVVVDELPEGELHADAGEALRWR